MCYNHLNRKCELEEFDLDFSAGELMEEDYPRLMLVNKNNKPGEKLTSSFIQADDEESKAEELSGEEDQELYTDSQRVARSSLAVYFKSINRCSLLNEEDERILAKRIKESEENCKNLVIKWNYLFKKKFLSRFSAKQKREISKRLNLVDDTYHLFDNLVILERDRKKVEREIKNLSHRSKEKQGLNGELYKIETEISKCIAEITLAKSSIDGIIKKLKKKNNSKRQQFIERKLRRILREINLISKEIKALKKQMVQANLRLVISIAKKYDHLGLELSDLIQEGNLGLMRAIDTYDYRRGHRFITYATWWVKQAMIRALDCQSRTIRKPVYISERLNRIVKASDRLLQEHKRQPTMDEIAEETNTPLEYIEKVIQSFKDPANIDDFNEEKGGIVINPSLNHDAVFILKQVISSNLSQITDFILSDLSHREREIIKLRFGIGTEHDRTLEEIGDEFNLSRERIRQILEVALNKIRIHKGMIQLKDFMDFN